MIWLLGNKADLGNLRTTADWIDLHMECDNWTNISAKENAEGTFNFFRELVRYAGRFKRRAGSNSTISDGSMDGGHSNVPRRSKSYDSLPIGVMKSIKRSYKKNGSLITLFRK